MTFADKMRVAAADKKVENEKTALEATEAKKAAWEAKKVERDAKKAERDANDVIKAEKIKDAIFIAATTKYHDSIKRGINNAAGNGLTIRRINFDRDDFKANCNGGGYPSAVLTEWLAEMCNPESKYLPIAAETTDLWNEGDKMHFEGVKCDVWNNKAFTVAFTW